MRTVYSFFQLGLHLHFLNVKKTHIKYLVIILTPQVLLFLITGNRGEVFYPILSALGVLIIVRNYKIKWWMIITIVFTLFFVIPFIKVFRNMDSSSIEKIDINWFSSLSNTVINELAREGTSTRRINDARIRRTSYRHRGIGRSAGACRHHAGDTETWAEPGVAGVMLKHQRCGRCRDDGNECGGCAHH